MSFCIEHTRKKSMAKLKELMRDGIISLEMIKDWLRTIYEIRFFDWNSMMAELMGKETGYCKGRGGSMYIAEVDKQNNLGSTGIVGGNQPAAAG